MDEFSDRNTSIKRIRNGFVLTLWVARSLGRRRHILITPDGEMIGFDGLPVIESDMAYAMNLLPRIGERNLGRRLFAGTMPNPAAIAVAKAELNKR